MSAVYDKALKRRDFSGIVNKDDKDKGEGKMSDGALAKGKKDKKREKGKKDKSDNPKAGADIGKIVNLMSGDSTRVRCLLCLACHTCLPPTELLLGSGDCVWHVRYLWRPLRSVISFSSVTYPDLLLEIIIASTFLYQ